MSDSHPQRSLRKEREGVVLSDKMDKTLVVRVARRLRHPVLKKVLTRYKKLYVHDDKGEAKQGDRVRIQETRPLSKLKRWRLMQVMGRGRGSGPGEVNAEES